MKVNVALFNRPRVSCLAGLMLACVAPLAHAATITNGTFATNVTYNSEFGSLCTSSTPCYGTTVTGWSSTGYNFVFHQGNSSAATSQYSTNDVSLPSSVFSSEPNVGNFIALDANYNSGPVTQTSVTGLSTTAANTISFWYDDTAQVGFSGGPITLTVSLGGVSQTVSAVSGWTLETLSFAPTSSSSAVLSFAASAPSGQPPFALIADVTSPTPGVTPEPSSLALLSTGLFGVAGVVRSRLKSKQ